MSDVVDNQLPEQPEAPFEQTPRQSVGEALKAARESRGLQVLEVAQTLKLGQRQVDALERNDWTALPGHTFIRGFVRNYARLLNLDPLPLMGLLDQALQKPVDTLDVPASAPTEMPSATSRGRDRIVVISGLALVLIALALYLWLPGTLDALRGDTQALLDGMTRTEAPAPPPPTEPAFPPGATAQQIVAPQANEAPAVPAQIVPAPQVSGDGQASTGAPRLRLVAAQESWVEVRDQEGNVAFLQRMPAGAEQILAGNGPLSLVIGFAPGVKIYSRGQLVDLVPHTKGDVARLVLE